MDRFSPERRSWLMSRIRGANTKPKLAVRSLLHGMGYRFRLHRKDLPGTPDIVLPGRSAAVFVHGCFWHGHACKAAKMPKSREDYWREKIEGNRRRDRRKRRQLRALGWQVIVVWECELKRPEALAARLREALGGPLRTAAADPHGKGQ
jgi:DNA mismatch endonuclease (patch repair protein)